MGTDSTTEKSAAHEAGGGARVLDQLLDPAHVQRLLARADQLRAGYTGADPFPHAVMDDFLPTAVLDRVLEAFPGTDDVDWQRFENAEERKLAFPHVEGLPPVVRDVLYFLNTAPMLEFLERLTGIERLIADPHYSGGGLHQILPGGLLGIHADFNSHQRLEIDRRLNLLLFLNVDWREEYGGHLELWKPDMSECVERVLPVFNRCVVFSTTDHSLHGHPDPLRCPEGRSRKSLATYYYTNGRPEEEVSAGHTTLFRARPGDAPRSKTSSWSLRGAVRALVPPLVWNGLRRVVGRK